MNRVTTVAVEAAVMAVAPVAAAKQRRRSEINDVSSDDEAAALDAKFRERIRLRKESRKLRREKRTEYQKLKQQVDRVKSETKARRRAQLSKETWGNAASNRKQKRRPLLKSSSGI